jgi:hypothetical protein
MDKSSIGGEVSVPSGGDAAEVFQPGVGSLNFPAAFVSPEFSAVFMRLSRYGTMKSMLRLENGNQRWRSVP